MLKPQTRANSGSIVFPYKHLHTSTPLTVSCPWVSRVWRQFMSTFNSLVLRQNGIFLWFFFSSIEAYVLWLKFGWRLFQHRIGNKLAYVWIMARCRSRDIPMLPEAYLRHPAAMSLASNRWNTSEVRWICFTSIAFIRDKTLSHHTLHMHEISAAAFRLHFPDNDNLIWVDVSMHLWCEIQYLHSGRLFEHVLMRY